MSETDTRIFMVGNSRAMLGRFTYGFENLSIREWNEGADLQIGAFCSLADGITVYLGGNHRADWITTYPFGHVYQGEFGNPNISGHPATKGSVIIGNDVWIGSGATIMSGVKIGDGAVVAARALIAKDVPPYSIVAGNPARLIKPRFEKEVVDLLLRLQWWSLPIDVIKGLIVTLCARPSARILEELIERYGAID